jgi:hypothetical protein
MWLSAIKISSDLLERKIYANKQQVRKMAMSDAQLHACLKNGPRRGAISGKIA